MTTVGAVVSRIVLDENTRREFVYRCTDVVGAVDLTRACTNQWVMINLHPHHQTFAE